MNSPAKRLSFSRSTTSSGSTRALEASLLRLRRLQGVPVGVLLTLRQGAETRPLDLESAFPEAALVRSTVGPLSLASSTAVRGRLGRPPASRLLKIEQASGGNPFYALEIGRALMRRGTDVTAREPSVRTASQADGRAAPSACRSRSACAAARGDGFRSDARDLVDAGVAEPVLVLEPAVGGVTIDSLMHCRAGLADKRRITSKADKRGPLEVRTR